MEALSGAFLTLAAESEAETRVRGSRFHALAAPAADEAAARAVLDARARAQFDATHHCAAWRFRDDTWRAIDAGEPSGSAGAPILAAIDAAGLVDVVVVVTRYFGGTKLGVGGLVRAYGDAAAAAVDAAPRLRGIAAARARIRYPYALTSVAMRALEHVATHDVSHGYAGSAGSAHVEFTLPTVDLPALEAFLTEQSSGALVPDVLGSSVLYLPA